jgi:hypothetical protein
LEVFYLEAIERLSVLCLGFQRQSGMAVMFLFTSLFGALTGLLGLLSPSIRRLDHNPSDAVEPSGQLDTALIPR